MTARYAIYFCPDAESELYRLGAAWLGYDAMTGADVLPELPAGLSEDAWRAATEPPRKYGFHATLKPPFRLADGADEAALFEAVADFAATGAPVALGRLEVRILGGFVALTQTDDPAPVSALAAACVERLDSFRAQADAVEIDHRRRAGLSPQEEQYLRRWGYPYVMDAFRFHVTLTGMLGSGDCARFADLLADRFAAALAAPFTVDSLCLFAQRSEDARFEFRERFVLGG